MNTQQLVIKAIARLVSKGKAEYFLKDGKPAVRLTDKGRKLVGSDGEIEVLVQAMKEEKCT